MPYEEDVRRIRIAAESIFKALGKGESAVWQAIHALQEGQVGTQEQVDADTQALAQVSADLATAHTALQSELDALQAQIDAAGAPVSLTGLTEAVQALDPAVKAVGALVPTPPAAPAVEVAAEPAPETPPAP